MLTRREAIGLFAVARVVAAAPSDKLRFTRLDHLQMNAADAAKSAALYARVFGGPIWKNNKTARRYVRLGPSYLVMEQGREPSGLDHFSSGIEGFEVADIHTYLEHHEIAYKDFPSGRDISVKDPDGNGIELSADNTWKQLSAATASPETTVIEGPAIFEPTGIDHILLNVAEPAKSASFYEKIFGPVAQREDGRIWFQVGTPRVGLVAGGKAGVNHFCVSAGAFDYDAATKKLAEIGARVEKPETSGVVEFRDADGLRVQVKGLRG